MRFADGKQRTPVETRDRIGTVLRVTQLISRIVAAALASLLLAVTMSAQPVSRRTAPRGRFRIPDGGTSVMMLAGIRPMVHVMINGHGPFRMLIETGSRISYLLPEQYAATFARDSARPSDVFRIGGATLTGITIQRNGRIGLPNVDGLLGLDALYDAAITIDFAAGVLQLSRDTLPDANGRDVIRLGVSSLFWTVPITLGTTIVHAIIDTQSGLSISSAPANVARLQVTAPPIAVGRARGPSIGNVIVERTRLDGNAMLGDAELQRPLIDLLPLASPLPGNAFILGLQVLTHFAFTLDQRVGRARFAREDRVVPAPPPAYATGMSTTQRSDGIRVVVSVLERTAAADAGIAVGDVIVRVDGRISSGMTDVEWVNAIGGRVPLLLRILRQGTERDILLTPRYLGF